MNAVNFWNSVVRDADLYIDIVSGEPSRAPDLTIGTKADPQTRRWHLPCPQELWDAGWRLNLHQWLKSDDDRALHDHRADSFSLLLTGGYYEVLTHAWEAEQIKVWYPQGSVIHRKAEQPHRVELEDAPIWTLWFRGPYRRDWGFYCKSGWKHWQEYVSQRDYSTPGSESTIGKGCDE